MGNLHTERAVVVIVIVVSIPVSQDVYTYKGLLHVYNPENMQVIIFRFASRP